MDKSFGNDQTLRQVAEGVLEAAKIREESFDKSSGTYALTIDMAAAAQDKCSDNHLVTMMLVSCWNDTLDWATGIIENDHSPA